jgi:hypothetical protein
MRWLRRKLAHLFNRHHQMVACVAGEQDGVVWYHAWCRQCEPEVGEMVQNAKKRRA